MQGLPDQEPIPMANLIESPLLSAGVQDVTVSDESWVDQALAALNPANVAIALWSLDADGWWFVRTFLHTVLGQLGSWKSTGNPGLRRLSRQAPQVTTGSLLFSAGFVAGVQLEIERTLGREPTASR